MKEVFKMRNLLSNVHLPSLALLLHSDVLCIVCLKFRVVHVVLAHDKWSLLGGHLLVQVPLFLFVPWFS